MANEDLLKTVLANSTVIGADGTETKMGEERAEEFFNALKERAKETEGENWEGVKQRLNESIDGLELTQLGGHVPIQGYGKYRGEGLYFRARWSSAVLKVGTTHPDGEDEDDHNVLSYPHFSAGARVTPEGDEYGAGWMKPEEVEVVFHALVANLFENTHEENVKFVEDESAAFKEMVDAMKAARAAREKESPLEEGADLEADGEG